jgi:hypothetical protein
MEAITAFSTLFLALFTAVMAAATFWLAKESREASFRQIRVQVWLDFLKRFDALEMRKARAELASKVFEYTPEKHSVISETVMNFFEDVGTAYFGGFLDKKLAYDSFSFHLCRWWIACAPYVEHERQRHETAKDLFTEFEKLAFEMQEPDEVIDAAELKAFLQDERRLKTDLY